VPGSNRCTRWSSSRLLTATLPLRLGALVAVLLSRISQRDSLAAKVPHNRNHEAGIRGHQRGQPENYLSQRLDPIAFDHVKQLQRGAGRLALAALPLADGVHGHIEKSRQDSLADAGARA
jgi:hypothetical protein